MNLNLVATTSIVSAVLLIVLPCLLHETKYLTLAFSSPAISTISLHHRYHHESSERYSILAATTNRKSSSSTAGVTDDGALGKKQNRQPWDIFRFVSQSSKFIRPPSLPQIVFGGENKRRIRSGEILWSPSSSGNFFNFSPLDDVVMGGASYSSMDNTSGLWRGVVTDSNNGGFVGIRSTPFVNGLVLDLSDCKGVILKVRTTREEGKKSRSGQKRYKFVVRDTTEFNGICWTTEFDVLVPNNGKSVTTEVRIPFAQQIPTIFAKTIRGQRFDDANIVGFQVAYSKFEYDGRLNAKFQLGEFDLQLLELRSF